MPAGKRWPTELHAEIRAEYETGSYSVLDLPARKKHGVSTRQVEHWIAAEGWVKGNNAPLIARKRAEASIERFTRLGLSQDNAFTLTIEGCLAGADIAADIRDKMLPKMTEGGTLTTDALMVKSLVDTLASYAVDLGKRAKFLELYFKATGQLEADPAPPMVFTVPDLSKLTTEELRAYRDILAKCSK
jgi:hypothetical protein